MANPASIQIIEDNGGGLHLICFDADENATHMFGDFEYGDHHVGTMQETALSASREGVSDWDGCVEDPQAAYDDLTSYQYGWKLIAEVDGGAFRAYPDRMGAAGSRWFGPSTEEG